MIRSDQSMRNENADAVDLKGVTSAEQEGEGEKAGRLPCQRLSAKVDQNGA